MIPFRKPEITDKSWVDEIVHSENTRSADYCFSTMFMWGESYRPRIARMGERLGMRIERDTPIYSFPIGSGSLLDAVEALKEDARERGGKLVIRGITEEMLPQLEEIFGGEYDLSFSDKQSDYVYSAEKLATLAGKKLHAKRNHIHRFEENFPDWTFSRLTSGDFAECSAFLERWLEKVGAERNADFRYEQIAIDRAFGNFDALGLEGGVLRIGGKVIAFTIGEMMSSDTYLTHFEKALPDYQGAYAMINREFAQQILRLHPEVLFINREEDMGIENLRKAKQSYYPEFLIKKFTAVWR